ncbi:MAG: PQQ-binding-like beta-propeller repeat protein, partial [Verrucomicrobiota bacterium]
QISLGPLDSGLLDYLSQNKRPVWEALIQTRVVTPGLNVNEAPPVTGRFSIVGKHVVFSPRFPFEHGLTLEVRFRPAGLPEQLTHPGPLTNRLKTPGTISNPKAAIETIYPTSGILSENHLKFYLHFTHPMERGAAYESISLIDAESDQPVTLPFLELGEELWDRSGKRLTLFFDPGRVKRELQPRDEVGPAIVSGRSYLLRVDRAWRDADGQPMLNAFEKRFTVGPPDYDQPDPTQWKIEVPNPGSLDPLTIRLGEPLDHGMLHRVINVASADGTIQNGRITTAREENLWHFHPADPWSPGRFRLEIDSTLEDLAGNNIDRPFETILTGRTPATKPRTLSLPFHVGKPAAENQKTMHWPGWRGPAQNGHFNGDLPLTWGPDQNIHWKIPVEGRGASTPIIWDHRLFLTTQIGRDPKALNRATLSEEGDGDLVFKVQCFNSQSGEPQWEKAFPNTADVTPTHRLNSQASPSCATDGQRVIALFATGLLVCLNFDGDLLWRKDLHRDYHAFDILWGHAGSPVIHGNQVLLLLDHDPAACLVSLDLETGYEQWCVDRGRGLRSYSTPVVFQGEKGDVIIVNSNPGVDAYEASNGKHLWRVEGFCKVPVPLPIIEGNRLFTSRGYRNGPYLAVNLQSASTSGKTRIAPLWQKASRAPYVSSLIHANHRLYYATEEGRIFCLDPTNGDPVWINKAGNAFWASPIADEDHIYFQDESGETVIVNTDSDGPTIVGRNRLGEKTYASPAVANDALYLRGENHLFCLRKPLETPE